MIFLLLFFLLLAMSNDYMIKRVSLEDIIHTAILNNKQLLIQNQFSIEVHTVDSLHYKKMARKILFREILFFLLILLIFNTQITFAFFFSFTIHLSVLALQITVELVSKNFFANL